MRGTVVAGAVEADCWRGSGSAAVRSRQRAEVVVCALLSCFTWMACVLTSGHALRGVLPGNFARRSVAATMIPVLSLG